MYYGIFKSSFNLNKTDNTYILTWSVIYFKNKLLNKNKHQVKQTAINIFDAHILVYVYYLKYYDKLLRKVKIGHYCHKNVFLNIKK